MQAESVLKKGLAEAKGEMVVLDLDLAVAVLAVLMSHFVRVGLGFEHLHSEHPFSGRVHPVHVVRPPPPAGPYLPRAAYGLQHRIVAVLWL